MKHELILWLGDHAAARRAHEKVTSAVYDGMPDKTTAFAESARILAKTHGEAAAVYEAELARQRGEG